MKIVPVIDLLSGRVVHARGGARERYRPLQSQLGCGSDPHEVCAALLRLHPFPALYIADLDAIAGRGDNAAAIAAIRRAHPDLELWLDGGFADPSRLRRMVTGAGMRPVIGSESLSTAHTPVPVARWHPRPLLSLDFRGEGFLGPPALLEDPGLWPDEVLIMSLARVGSAGGPDLPRLGALRARAPRARLYAAGGVRGPGDLAALAQAGAAGALVASALHGRDLRAEHLKAFA